MSIVNLIPVPRLVARRRATIVRRWAWVCAGYGAALLGAYGGVAAAWDYDRDGLQQAVDHQVSANEKGNEELRRLETECDKARANLEANRAVGDQPDWSILLRIVGKLAEGKVALRECQVEPLTEPTVAVGASKEPAPSNVDTQPTRYLVKIRAMSPSWEAAAEFADGLRRSGLFERVDNPEGSRLEPFMSGMAIATRLECVLTGAEKPR